MSSVQLMTGVPPLPNVNGTTGERRRDGSKTDRHAALPRDVEKGQCTKSLRDSPLRGGPTGEVVGWICSVTI